MKKLGYLLDSTTIINFPFLWKLILRYWKSSLVISVLVVFFTAAFYLSQSDLYTTAVKFTDMNAKVDPAILALSGAVGGGKSQGSSSADISGLKHSRDFTRRISERLFANPFFYQLNFGRSLIDVHKKNGAQIFRNCKGDKTCVLDTIAKMISQFYALIDSERSNTNYVLQVQAADKETASIMLREIRDALHDTRISYLRSSLAGQSKITLEMLEQNKKKLVELEYDRKLEAKALLDSQVVQLENQISSQNKIIIDNQANLSRMESRVKGTRDALKNDINFGDLNADKKRRSLEEKINSLTNDIHSLEVADGGVSSKDEGILKQLRQELKETQTQLSSLKKGRHSLVSTDRFMKTAEESSDVSEFDYKVFGNHFEKANKVYKEMLAQKTELLERQLKLQEELLKLEPSVNFVKALEAKLLQVKLMEETVTTDLRFDTFAAPPDNSKRVGKLLMVAYMIIILTMILITYLITRYLVDDRIYDADDLKKFVGDVPILGETPKFDD